MIEKIYNSISLILLLTFQDTKHTYAASIRKIIHSLDMHALMSITSIHSEPESNSNQKYYIHKIYIKWIIKPNKLKIYMGATGLEPISHICKTCIFPN